jgi:hypothetical protein
MKKWKVTFVVVFVVVLVVLSVPTATITTIGPSTIATSTTTDADIMPKQPKSFYQNGLFWEFFSNGTDIVYYTSPNGTTWTSQGTVRAGGSKGNQFGVFADGTYIHYVYSISNGNNNSPLYYRRGTTNSDGTITWTAAEQTAVAADAHHCFEYAAVATDTNGVPYIIYSLRGDDTGVVVTKATTADGYWSGTASGFPYTLIAGNYEGSPVRLTSGKMGFVYGIGKGYPLVRTYDGSNWNDAQQLGHIIQESVAYNMVAQRDDIHIVYLTASSLNVEYGKYRYSGNSYGREIALQSACSSTDSYPVIRLDPATNDLYAFWSGCPTTNHMYYRQYQASTSTWLTTVDWITESDGLTANNRLQSHGQFLLNQAGVMYMSKSSSPYNMRFAALQLGKASLMSHIVHGLGLVTAFGTGLSQSMKSVKIRQLVKPSRDWGASMRPQRAKSTTCTGHHDVPTIQGMRTAECIDHSESWEHDVKVST